MFKSDQSRLYVYKYKKKQKQKPRQPTTRNRRYVINNCHKRKFDCRKAKTLPRRVEESYFQRSSIFFGYIIAFVKELQFTRVYKWYGIYCQVFQILMQTEEMHYNWYITE